MNEAMAANRALRREADQRSNVNGAPPKPAWATGTATENMASGTSIFDPVLCELVYRWFCPPGGLVIDPFAGGSVRGIVAAVLGRRYWGCDLRAEQIAANEEQSAAIFGGAAGAPEWRCGDSRALAEMEPPEADLVFTCPPYGDLERYSDDPADLSTMAYDEFRREFAAIIAASCGRLRDDRFAAVCVGDFRDARGFYRGFVGDAVDAFRAAGLGLYNEAILLTAVGSLPIRVARAFESTRKLGKTHQNLLVFCKGDPRKATAAISAVEFGDLEAELAGEGIKPGRE